MSCAQGLVARPKLTETQWRARTHSPPLQRPSVVAPLSHAESLLAPSLEPVSEPCQPRARQGGRAAACGVMG